MGIMDCMLELRILWKPLILSLWTMELEFCTMEQDPLLTSMKLMRMPMSLWKTLSLLVPATSITVKRMFHPSPWNGVHTRKENGLQDGGDLKEVSTTQELSSPYS